MVQNIVRKGEIACYKEKEKLHVISNFSFSHNIFHSFISLVHQNGLWCGKGLR